MPKVRLAGGCPWVLVFMLVAGDQSVHAAIRYWTNGSGGLFSSPLNWSPNAVPDAGDSVWFTNSGAYPVTVDVPALNQAAFFHRGSITQAMASELWRLTDEWRVGETPGETSRVTLVSGMLAVTNSAGTAVLSVGGSGAGQLAIRGGEVVADRLVATNGSRSILTFPYGVLSTLRGSVISNGSPVVLGGNSNIMVWNIRGGTNAIITDQFTYGGLTLGGGGRAVADMEGEGTVLEVPGIDATGGHRLLISNGAKLHTYRIQWGLGSSGTSNLVAISGAGSSWINDDLMFFGMHAGGQTMIISNGGYFQTGGAAFSDQRFAMNNSGNRIIVTGSNSWFNSVGTAEFGINLCTGVCQSDSAVLVTNGARFWARQLRYGMAGSAPGNVVEVADGTLWIGSLSFATGTIRIGEGNGTIDELSMTGGSNAILQVQGNLYMGHHGSLDSGGLRIGRESITLPALNGELRAGGWKLGAYAGDSGNATMTGGSAFVTNAAGNATLVVGDQGSGTLRINAGQVYANSVRVGLASGGTGQLTLSGPAAALYAPDLQVGAGGAVAVSNAALLRVDSCTSPSLKVSVSNAVLEFGTGTPAIANNAITTIGGTVSYHAASAAAIAPDDPVYLGRIHRLAGTVLRLVDSTNSWQPSIVVRDNEPTSWPGLVMMGQCGVQAGNILVAANGRLAATNSITRVTGNFTNAGAISLHKSTLWFSGPATLTATAQFEGVEGLLLFDGGLNLPASDIVVPQGVSIRAASITSEGGRLIISGGGIVPSEGGAFNGLVTFQNGWITYVDTPAVPLALPAWIEASTPVGLELVRSTNALTVAHTFPALGGYHRLRLGSQSTWQSQELQVSPGGGMFLTDSSAAVRLSSVFRVNEGGFFRDETGRPSYVGFDAAASNAQAVVSGPGSLWTTADALSIGSRGTNNQLLIQQGGRLASSAGTIGPSWDNRVILDGEGSTWFSTNSLTVEGFRNRLLVQTGAHFFGSQMVISNSAELLVSGSGAAASCTGAIRLASARAAVTNGAHLLSVDGRLEGRTPSRSDVTVSGAGSLWRLSGGLTITSGTFVFQTNQVTVQDGGVISASNVSVLGPMFGFGPAAALNIRAGSLFVTNTQGNAILTANGVLNLNRGLLRADHLAASAASSSALNIRAGIAEWRSCDLALGIPLRVGDGTNQVMFALLGGTNVCRGGLEIRPRAVLNRRGSIIGAVTNRGEIWPSALTIRGNLGCDPASRLMFSIVANPGSPENSSLTVTGRVSLGGSLAVALASGMTPSAQDVFPLIQYGSLNSSFSNVAFGQRLFTADGLASFRIENSGTAISATDFRPEDVDGDGIQDTWAEQYFGVTPLPPGTGPTGLDGDFDGDGLSNRDEFTMQTDPTDPLSSFRLQIEPTQAGPKITFPHVEGFFYQVVTSDDLVTWTKAPIGELQFDPNGLAEWIETTGWDSSSRMYRVLKQ